MSKIEVTFFGDFTIKYNNKEISEKSFRSKKMWTLLEYLIAFRNKSIPSLELIDVLWKEDNSENPTNALKTLLHRTRNLLSELNFDNADSPIINANGRYLWNNEIEMAIDTDIFESYYLEIKNKNLSDDEKISSAFKAIILYKGTFLSNSASEYWVIPLSTYYNSIFIEIVHILIELLYNQNRFLEIVEICRNAIAINPYEEDFYYFLINALYETGNCRAAIEHYKNVETFFYNNFGVNLSEKFISLFNKINDTKNDLEFDLGIIEDSLFEKDKISGGFFCEYEFFKKRFQLEIRAAQRNKTPVQICLVSITDERGKLPPQKKLNASVDALIDIVRCSLRSSDLFSRFSVSQFIIMLADTTYDNAKIVLNRIQNNCSKSLKVSGIKIICDLKNYCEDSNTFVTMSN